MNFREDRSLENRRVTSETLIKQYPDRIPVIVKSDFISKDKFLTPATLTVSSFMKEICKYSSNSSINRNEGIFIFIGNIIPSPSDVMQNLYNRYKDEDGFLYVTLEKENSFGAAASN